MRPAVLALLPLSLLLACDAPPPIVDDNAAPVARLLLPQLWPAGEPASLDATRSSDVDGDELDFSITPGDGTPALRGAGLLEHVYGAPGTFEVELTASDGELSARVTSRIVVVGDAAEPCDCAAPCLEDGICVDGLCMVFASSSADEARAPIDGELDCST